MLELKIATMISVVVPVLNEAGNINPLIDEIHQALSEGLGEYEIIYINDGSSDQTAAELEERKKKDHKLKVITHESPCGQSCSLRTGILKAKGPWIVTLDGDGQNHPGDIPKLFQAIPQDVTPETPWLAIGHRVNRQDKASKKWASRFANNLRSKLLKDATPDTGCGIKLFSRQTFLKLPWFNHMHRYFPALIKRAGGNSISVPVRHRERGQGNSKYGVWDRAWVGISDLIGVRWLMKRNAIPSIIEKNE